MAAITRVYTLALVAEMLSEDVDWLSEIAGEMEPEDGYLWIYGPNEEQTEGFTDFDIDNLINVINVIREYKSNRTYSPGRLRAPNSAAGYDRTLTIFRACRAAKPASTHA